MKIDNILAVIIVVAAVLICLSVILKSASILMDSSGCRIEHTDYLTRVRCD